MTGSDLNTTESEAEVARQHLRADGILIVVTLMAAAGWIFSREALQGMPPLEFIGLRFLGAALLLTVLTRMPFVQRSRRPATGTASWKVGLPSALVFSVTICVWIKALQLTEQVGVGAFITSLSIVLVPLAGWLIYGERAKRAQWLSLPVSALGLLFLALDNLDQPDTGHLLFALAAVLFAITFTLTGKAVRLLPALPLTIVQLAIVGGVSLAISLLFENWTLNVPVAIWGWLLASLVVATAMRFYFQALATGLSSANHAAVILTVEPVFTATLATFWLGESLSNLQLIGCSIIFGAMLIARWSVIRSVLPSWR